MLYFKPNCNFFVSAAKPLNKFVSKLLSTIPLALPLELFLKKLSHGLHLKKEVLESASVF